MEVYREFTLENLRSIAPKAKQEILTNLVMYEDELHNADIIGRRKQFFLAQLAHESDGFKTTEEYASGRGYEGREDLGNTEVGDGVRYKGRGLIQLTGKFNYEKYGPLVGADLVSNPELAAKFPFALTIAIAYWTQKKLNSLADQDDFELVTRRINGGLNGLSSRYRYLELIEETGIGEDEI